MAAIYNTKINFNFGEMNNQLTGSKGETLAAEFLRQKGFILLEKNWRYKFVEIDIIASCKNVLHFIEVKTRTGTTFGHPEESVSKKKMEQLRKGAEQYQYLHPQWKQVCFDVLAITICQHKTEYWFNEDVYF